MKLSDKSIATFPTIVLMLSVLLLASDLGHVATRLRGVLFDAYQNAQPRTYVDTAARAGYVVRVLDVDAASLARFGPWPWPRSTLAALLGKLKQKGAALAVLAFPLDVPDPLSPKNLVAQTPPGPAGDAARAALETMQSPDVALTNAMAHLATATGFVLGAGSASRPLALRTEVASIGTKYPFGQVPAFASASQAIAPLERMSAGVGALNLTFDADGEVRRMPLLFRLGDTPVPALTAEILRLIEHEPQVVVRGASGRLFGSGIAGLNVRDFELPTDPDGSFWLAFAGKRAERTISAAALDEGGVSGARLANAIVVLAAPGESLVTPLGTSTLANVYAEALENVLTGSTLRRPVAAGPLELIFLTLLGLAGIVILVRFGVLWSGVFTVVVVVTAFAVAWYLYSADHILIDALGPSVALGLMFAAGAATRGYHDARARSRVRSAFAQTLPLSVVDQIARNPETLAPDGVTRTVSYLCCGIQDFDVLSDRFKDEPAALTQLLRRLIAALVEEAIARGATLDHIAVDGFSAFWNAPLDDTLHAVHACEAASAMIDVLAKTNAAIAQEHKDESKTITRIEIGVGIATGEAIAGGINIHGRTSYSVSGGCTFVARRIQQLSAQYGTSVIVADATRQAAERGFAFLEVDYIAAGARGEPIKLHALLGNPVMRASPKFRAMLTFHEHIFHSLRAQQWNKARELIEQCRRLSGASQKLYDLYLSRIALLQQNPPGREWDGAFRPISE